MKPQLRDTQRSCFSRRCHPSSGEIHQGLLGERAQRDYWRIMSLFLENSYPKEVSLPPTEQSNIKTHPHDLIEAL